MKNLLLLITLSLLSNNIIANTTIENLLENNPEKSKYEVLQLFYDEAEAPAKFEDFDDISVKKKDKTQHCRLATSENPSDLSENYIWKYKTSSEESEEPISSDKQKNVLLPPTTEANRWGLDGFFEEGNYSQIKKLVSAINMQESKTDLTINIIKDTAQYGADPSNISFRKNGDLIAYKLLQFKSANNGPLFKNEVILEAYGYCWID